MARYAVVSFLDRQVDGAEFPAGELPLHVTVVGSFSIDASAAVLELLGAVGDGLPVELTVGVADLFGASADVPVSVIEDAAAAHALHDRLLHSLREAGAEIDTPHYVGEGYRAHVTHRGGAAPAVGDVLTLDALSLVDLRPDGRRAVRRVVATLPA